MASNSNRMNKIDEELRKEISNIITTELKNPHLTGLISVTKVKTTPDLRYAQVFVSMIGEKNRKHFVGGHSHNSFAPVSKAKIVESC